MPERLPPACGAFFLLLVVLGLASCAAPGRQAQPCAHGRPMVRTTLFFGLPPGPKAGARWARFVRSHVARHFPEGFTVLQARGAWRSRRTGRTLHQRSRVVVRLHPGRAADHQAVEAVRRAYRTQFRQESVLRVDERVCASFQAVNIGRLRAMPGALGSRITTGARP